MDLEISQDTRFQEREWRAERIGWAVMTLFVLAGVAGVLGAGPVSWASTTSTGGVLVVDHDRVVHFEADDSLTLRFGPDAVHEGMVTVEVSGSWPGGVDVQGVSPEPSEQRLVRGGLVLEFPVEEPDAVAEPGDLEVTISFRAQDVGPLTADLTVGTDTVSVSQLVLP